MALDYEALRAITQRALAKGAIQKSPDPEPPPAPAVLDSSTVQEAANLDFAVLNQVFGLALNSSLSPLRMVRAIHHQYTRMTPNEREQIPEIVREMVEGLQCSMLSIKKPVNIEPIAVEVSFNSPTTASIHPVNPEQFHDLVLRLEGSAGWDSIRGLLHHCHIGDGSILMQGALVSAVQHDLKSVLEACQRFPASQENLLTRMAA